MLLLWLVPVRVREWGLDSGLVWRLVPVRVREWGLGLCVLREGISGGRVVSEGRGASLVLLGKNTS